MNEFASLLGPGFKGLFNNAIDGILDASALAVQCRLYYDTTDAIYCNNCVFDPILSKSFNKYNNTGPLNFPEGSICPVCGGYGKILHDTTEIISMAMIFDSKYWMNWGANFVNIPNLAAQSLSHISLMPKILNSTKLTVVSVESYDNGSYSKAGQPTPMGLGGHNYILTNWTRP